MLKHIRAALAWPLRALGPFAVIAVILALAGGGLYLGLRRPQNRMSYHTAPLKRGDLDVLISATGTVEPEETVDVGAQVAGQILVLGNGSDGKTIDFGSSITEGALIAKIDDSLYRATVQQGEAQLERSKATVLEAKAHLDQADRDWKRAQQLGPSSALAPSAYDNYRATFETAQATLADAKAQVSQSEAALVSARRNLEYCTINSPVTGVVIDRRVNIGQTVVSSLNTPSLFLIAKDLHRLEVWVSVNEADIGKIVPDQHVSFTVDAFPGETFAGTVKKLRLNASMSQNVVTYVVEVSVDNSSGRLLPYLTANVKFEVLSAKDVLLVPNAALRWKPTHPGGHGEAAKGTETSQDADSDTGDRSSDGANEAAQTDEKESSLPRGSRVAKVWVRGDGARPHPVKLTVGQSDGVMTEVLQGDLSAGDEVIIGSTYAAAGKSENGGSQDAKSPFAPSMPSRHGGMR